MTEITRVYPLTSISLVDRRLSIESYFTKFYVTPSEPKPGRLIESSLVPEISQAYFESPNNKDQAGLRYLSLDLNDYLGTDIPRSRPLHFVADINKLSDEEKTIFQMLGWGVPHWALMSKFGIDELVLTLHESRQFDGKSFYNGHNSIITSKAQIAWGVKEL